MKKTVFVTLFTAISIVAYSQSWTPDQYRQAKGLIADSVLRAPRIDTVSKGGNKDSLGMILYRPADDTYYGKKNGRWAPFSSGNGDLSDYYTKEQTNRFFMGRKMSRIFPYDSSYFVPPSVPGASDIELINFGNTIHQNYPIYENPMALWSNNWAVGLGVNVQYDSVARRYKIFNKNYPVAYYEAGWEGCTPHCIPAGVADSVDLYPHEIIQFRAGLDGSPLLDAQHQYNQIKAPLAARYDTNFSWQSTAYGWWGEDLRPFIYMFSEIPMANGNRYADFAQYMTAVTSGAKFEFSRSRGTYAAKTVLQANDTIGNVIFNGFDGSNMLPLVRIYAKADGNGAANNVPSSVTMRATNGSASSGTLSVTSIGNVGINRTDPVGVLHTVKEGVGGAWFMDRYTVGGGNLPPSLYGIASNGTVLSPSAILHGNRLLSLNGSGYDGSTLDRTARGSIALAADTNWSTTAKSTRFEVYLTNIVDDSRKVFSINHAGRAAFADTTDPVAKLWVDGLFKSGIQASSGAYDIVVRNQATGMYESKPSTTYAPAATNGYVELSPASRQSGSFSINTSSSIVSTGNALLSIGQTTATPTNIAGIQMDGVDGNFTGADYLSLNQSQTGNAFLRNFNSTGTLVLGAGGSSSTNITLSPNNVTSFGGATRYPIVSTSGNLTLTPAHSTVIVTNSSHVITLPAASSCPGQIYDMVNYNTGGNVTISSVLRNGTATTLLPDNAKWRVQSDATNWYVIKD